MVSRRQYADDLRAAVDTALSGRTEILIADLGTAIYEAGFAHDEPAPTTLARLLVNRGWAKTPSDLPGTLYAAPAEPEDA